MDNRGHMSPPTWYWLRFVLGIPRKLRLFAKNHNQLGLTGQEGWMDVLSLTFNDREVQLPSFLSTAQANKAMLPSHYKLDLSSMVNGRTLDCLLGVDIQPHRLLLNPFSCLDINGAFRKCQLMYLTWFRTIIRIPMFTIASRRFPEKYCLQVYVLNLNK